MDGDRPCRRFAWVLAAICAMACERGMDPVPLSERLVDLFNPSMVIRLDSDTGDELPRHEWRFDGPASRPPPSRRSQTRGWEPVTGVSGLTLANGRLQGKSTTASPIVRLVREAPFPTPDVIHEVQIRLQVSVGRNLGVDFIGAEVGETDRARLSGATVPWFHESPLVAGSTQEVITVTPTIPVRGNEIQQILIRPTDVAGASFAIESVRLVFRREHLASIPTGIGWHGLSEVYRETVVSRARESIRWPLLLPQRPRLSLSLGTLDVDPVTFQIAIETEVGKPTESSCHLVRRTVTTPHRWQDLDLDLSQLAGREVTVVLSVEAEARGTLGLWGSPTVRQRAVRTSGRGREGGTGARPQAVLFILGDTLRPDRLDAYGHSRATAPAVARLARQGTLFRDVLAQASWTKVSAPSLLTSLYPTSSGVRDFSDRLPSSATTLAEVYRQAGYATVGFSSIAFTGKFSNLHQGYEELHERQFEPAVSNSKTARGFVDLLLPWMERHREVPFFVFLHLFDPHSPYEPESPYNARWADPSWHSEHRDQAQTLRGFVQDPLMRRGPTASRDEFLAAGLDSETYISRELDWYDGSIRAMDDEVGRVLERLGELDLDERALVVFASDHGEEFLEHGGMFHGQSVYGELTQVPLVLRYPGVVPAGGVVQETIELLDLMPTMLELSGLESPAEVQGQSVVSLLGLESMLLGPTAPGRGSQSWRAGPAISEKPRSRSPVVPPPRDLESLALVHDGWKLIRHHHPGQEDFRYELFERQSDPLDRTDVAGENPEVVERLSALLMAWHARASTERLASDGESAEGLDSEERKRLRALGYLE